MISNSSYHIASDVNPERIHPSATIHPGCRIGGAETYIGPDCEIGAESPVTLRDCQLGKGVKLGGGFAEGSVFMDGAAFGDGFHIRPGTIAEEAASGGHSVGLKQTILFPYVTLGSLINFCDVLMAGGDGSKNHSEVGSSYIHFNFTPHQDKATASLVGDVARGVLLREKPIFLGGHGGLVGPRRIAYGTVVAAGTILRKDVTEQNRLVTGAHPFGPLREHPYDQSQYGDVARIAANCFEYVRNIIALSRWYSLFRAPVMNKTPHGAACLRGAAKCLAVIMKERVLRLDQLESKLPPASAASHPSHAAFVAGWKTKRAEFRDAFASAPVPPESAVAKFAAAADYLSAVRALSPDECGAVSTYLSL